jgi:hypothetical protein
MRSGVLAVHACSSSIPQDYTRLSRLETLDLSDNELRVGDWVRSRHGGSTASAMGVTACDGQPGFLHDMYAPALMQSCSASIYLPEPNQCSLPHVRSCTSCPPSGRCTTSASAATSSCAEHPAMLSSYRFTSLSCSPWMASPPLAASSWKKGPQHLRQMPPGHGGRCKTIMGRSIWQWCQQADRALPMAWRRSLRPRRLLGWSRSCDQPPSQQHQRHRTQCRSQLPTSSHSC